MNILAYDGALGALERLNYFILENKKLRKSHLSIIK